MIDFASLKTISTDDSKRLETSFFRPPKKEKPHSEKKKKLIIISSAAIAVILVIIFLVNFKVLILPEHKKSYKAQTIQLLDKKNLSSLEFSEPRLFATITGGIIYFDVPFNTKTGFTVNLAKKIDLSNAQLVVLLKAPHNEITVDAILRDVNFFSNSRKPLRAVASNAREKETYVELGFDVQEDASPNLNLVHINQLRFYFSQKEVSSMPVIVKNIIVKKLR